MKIGFLLRDLSMGGTEVTTIRLAEQLTQMGHECHLICLTDVKVVEHNQQIIHHVLDMPVRFHPKLGKVYAPVFLEWFYEEERKNGEFDAVFCGHGESLDICAYIEDERFVQCVHTGYSYAYNQRNWFKKLRYKQKFGPRFNNKHTICVSEGLIDECKQIFKQPYRSYQCIYNPFDIEKIQKLAQEDSPFNLEKPYITFVGRFEEPKRVDILIEAFQHVTSNVDLVLVGEGSWQERLEKQIASENLTDRIHIIPFCDNPYPIMNQAELFVLTSVTEGLPTVLIESLICHTPIVSVDCPTGPREIMKNYFDNNLVESHNPLQIARQIDHALTTKSDINFKESYQRFSADCIAKAYIDFIENTFNR
ncbi:glycosyltransferase [Algicola sagamiensis]|uniref:glycosyltransferase n=1 Tax=Algicola sagamiensis TaxID=163869 RepID=UPI000A039F50|nr:glycosyltransferase [Algicola sagamiensis]